MSARAALTLRQAEALREVSAGYGCALITASGVEPVTDVVNVALEDGTVASFRDPANREPPRPTYDLVASIAMAAKTHDGSIAFHEEAYAEVLAPDLVAAGISCHVHLYDEPFGDFRAALVFE